MQLVRKPTNIVTVLALFADVEACANAVAFVMDEGIVPRCMELMDGPTLTAMRGQGLAIEWKDWNRHFGLYTLNFQVRLWENGVIEFFYGTMQEAWIGSGAAG